MRAPLSLALLLAFAGPAAGDAKKEAKVHLDKAAAHHAAGRYDEARKSLEIAYTLDPQPALLYAIGQVHVMQGQCPQAITFYERFIESKPSEAQAKKAQEAIDTCKQLQAPVEEKPIEETPVEKPVPEKIIIEKPVTVVTSTRPWYTDVVGDVLVVAGIGVGIVGAIYYRGAVADRDEADRVMSYEAYDDLMETAGHKQRVAIGLSVGAAALVTAGIVSYVVRDRSVETRTVSVVPTREGGMVTWFAQF